MVEDGIVPSAFLQQIFETIRQVDAKELQVSNEMGKFREERKQHVSLFKGCLIKVFL